MKKVIPWMIVVLVMGVIFYFSDAPAVESRRYSIGITDKVLVFVQSIFPDTQLNGNALHHDIRKLTHFFIYMILGILTFSAFMQNRQSVYVNMMMTMAICVIFAISDEIHQLFIPGRSGEVRDVLIDSSGAFLGVVVVLGVKGIMKRKRGKHQG